MIDSDNVLLLRPVDVRSGFAEANANLYPENQALRSQLGRRTRLVPQWISDDSGADRD